MKGRLSARCSATTQSAKPSGRGSTPLVFPINAFVDGSSWHTHTLTSDEIAAKQYTLSPLPASSAACIVMVRGGGIMFPGLDYEIDNSGILSWDGLGLEEVLLAGDTLGVRY